MFWKNVEANYGWVLAYSAFYSHVLLIWTLLIYMHPYLDQKFQGPVCPYRILFC